MELIQGNIEEKIVGWPHSISLDFFDHGISLPPNTIPLANTILTIPQIQPTTVRYERELFRVGCVCGLGFPMDYSRNLIATENKGRDCAIIGLCARDDCFFSFFLWN